MLAGCRYLAHMLTGLAEETCNLLHIQKQNMIHRPRSRGIHHVGAARRFDGAHPLACPLDESAPHHRHSRRKINHAAAYDTSKMRSRAPLIQQPATRQKSNTSQMHSHVALEGTQSVKTSLHPHQSRTTIATSQGSRPGPAIAHPCRTTKLKAQEIHTIRRHILKQHLIVAALLDIILGAPSLFKHVTSKMTSFTQTSQHGTTLYSIQPQER